MITFRIAGKTALGRLESQTFTVVGEPVTEKLLNEIAKAVPVIHSGSPTPDKDLFEAVAQRWPVLTLVSEDEAPERKPGRIY